MRIDTGLDNRLHGHFWSQSNFFSYTLMCKLLSPSNTQFLYFLNHFEMKLLLLWMFLFNHLQEGEQCSIAELTFLHQRNLQSSSEKPPKDVFWLFMKFNWSSCTFYMLQQFTHSNHYLFICCSMSGNKKAYSGVRFEVDWSLVWLTNKKNVIFDILELPAFRKYST